MIRIGICDAEEAEIEKIKIMIDGSNIIKEEYGYVEFSPGDLNFDVEEDCFESDILITGIYFKDLPYDGIGVAKKINQKYPACKIIFLSKYVEFVDYSYEAAHVYFIQKKNINKFLLRAVQKAYREYRADIREKILDIFSEGRKIYCKINDIVLIERDNRNIKIITTKGSFTCILSLKKILERVSDFSMVRANGSTIVNIRHVAMLTNEKLFLDNDSSVEIGETYKENVHSAYLYWWKDRI